MIWKNKSKNDHIYVTKDHKHILCKFQKISKYRTFNGFISSNQNFHTSKYQLPSNASSNWNQKDVNLTFEIKKRNKSKNDCFCYKLKCFHYYLFMAIST